MFTIFFIQDAEYRDVMSGSRGRKVTANRPGGHPRWSEHEQPYYNSSAPIPDLRYLNTWNGHPQTSYNWPHSSNLHPVWPPPRYRGGYFTEDHLPRAGSFDQFQHRLPQSFNPPNHFAERSLAHLNNTPLNELTSGSHSGSRDLATPQESSSSHNKQSVSAKDTPYIQGVRNKVPDKSATGKSRIPNSGSQQEISNPRSKVSASGTEKQCVPAKPTSFMPPNDDLRNKVKASLEKFAATKDHAPSKTKSSTVEPPLPLSPQKVRESRVPSMDALPSPNTRYTPRVAAGSHRRISQSSSTPNAAVNNDAASNPLEGIGFIQNTSSENSSCADKVTMVLFLSQNH